MLIQEFRHALGNLFRRPGFSVPAILTLALGIGSSSALFTVLYGVVLRPLPFPEPHRLAVLQTSENGLGRPLSDANFTDYRNTARSFEQLEAYGTSRSTLLSTGEPEVVSLALVTPGFLPLLGIQPAIGRSILESDATPNAPNVVVLSDAVWRRKYQADPQILSKTAQLDGRPHQIIGVLPPDAGYPRSAELWLPTVITTNRFANRLIAIGRLRPGASVEQARAEAAGIGQQLQQYPENKSRGGSAILLTDAIVGTSANTIWILFGAVLMLLLIGCANVANLQLVRAGERTREIAVRMALGAGRGAILRNLFLESVALSLIGGAAGVLVAVWGVGLLLNLKPSGIPRLSDIRIDAAVLLFSFAASMLSAVFFGLWPALRASKLDLNEALKQAGRSNSVAAGTTRTRAALGAVQVALALVLLIGATLLGRSLSNALSTDLGFRAQHVLSARFTLPSARYPDTEKVTKFHLDLVDRISSLPGVISTSEAQCGPLEPGCYWNTSFAIEGEPAPRERPSINHYYIMPKYFVTLGIPLLEGRDFNVRDLNTRVTIVGKRFAREYFAGRSPIGRRFELGLSKQFYEIVGVVEDVKTGSIEGSGMPQAYFPAPYPNASYVILMQGDPTRMANAVREQIRALDPEVAVMQIRPMENNISDAVGARRFQTWLFGFFAGVAAVLAVIGIYGVIAYSAGQRVKEIGVRIALGATGAQVTGLFVRQAVVMTAAGLAVGLFAAAAASRLLARLLFGVTATDPLTYVAVAVVFLIAAAAASFLPAVRAARTEPVIALRND